MSKKITIVMYHFVRNLSRTRYPGIKGLTTQKFIGQLDYLQQNYRIVTVEQCVRALRDEAPLPENAALLTFDDGYVDHYTTVFPLLNERGLQGCFFPPVRAITHHEVMNVNKIHFVLATASLPELTADLLRALDRYRVEWKLRTTSEYLADLHHPSRWDLAEVIFIKRMLQRELPELLRKKIVDELFTRYVLADEAAFAQELYMTPTQLRCMVRHGMYVGSHGYGHTWMNTLTPEEQVREVEQSLDFLDSIGAPTKDWAMCYPYGAYNTALIEIVRRRGGALVFTTAPGVAELTPEHALTLPRLDTNDLPQPLSEADE